MEIKSGPKYAERKELENTFIEREFSGQNEDLKQPIRERIAKFFASHKTIPTRCFCLPGVRWAFENELEKHTGFDSKFIGVERNYSIIEKGIVSMPGYGRILHDVFDTKKRRFRGCANRRSSILWCKASSFMGQTITEDMTKRDRHTWWRTYRMWTCAWLDFSGPIGNEILTCCKRLETHISREQESAPIAITFMLGREDVEMTDLMDQFCPNGSALDRRHTLIRLFFESNRYRNAVPVDCWQYESVGGAPMGVATFLMRQKG